MIMLLMMMGSLLIVPLLLIGVAVYVLGWRLPSTQSRKAQAGQSPLEILKGRYARGEVTREEYDRMHRVLKG